MADPKREGERPEVGQSHWSGRKSIVRRLWVSFALLLVILAVSGVISSYLLLQVVAIVKRVVEVEDPWERAALEMEINIHEATLGLLNFVHDPQKKHVEKYEDSNADYRRYAEVFDALMAAGGQGALSAKVTALEGEHQRLGERIIVLVTQRDDALSSFRAQSSELDSLIDESLQKELDPAAPDYLTKLNAALDMEINADETSAAIVSYVQSPTPELRRELDDAVEDFERFEALYRQSELSSTEQSVLDHIAQEFAETIRMGREIFELSDALEGTLQDFRDKLEKFDVVIDEEVQPFIHERKQTAYSDTQSRSLFALTIILTMALVVLVIMAVSTWVITTKIARSFWILVSGIDQVAQGNLEHRIKLDSEDELGKLGAAFNQMVAQRKRAVDALDEKNSMLEALSTKLSKYLSPQVYESIFSGAQEVAISTQRKKLTVFFSDLKDFTSTTDDLEPEELTALLNDYLTEMSDIALHHGATIDKYIGDAMLLFFGDPKSEGVQEDALRCVNMAIAMQRRMVGLRAKWQDFGQERPFHIRIGINTGFCNVGNFGSDVRMDYTIIGGEVNLAARLEGICEPDGIMLAHETYALVRNSIDAEEQEPLNVKGISRKIRPYAIKGIFDQHDGEETFLRSESQSLRLHVDLRNLEERDRIEVAEELERQARRLRGRPDDGG